MNKQWMSCDVSVVGILRCHINSEPQCYNREFWLRLIVLIITKGITDGLILDSVIIVLGRLL